MNKLFAAVLSLSLSATAFACNWDRQNCTESILKDVPQQLAALKQNQEFMQKYGQEVQFKAQYTDQQARTCNSNRACNTVYNNFAGWVYLHYMNYVKKPQQQAAKSVPDDWASQCVIGKGAGAIYSDATGVVKTAKVSDYGPYNVTQTNGGALVGLTDAESNKFVGWAKKAELQMQDLRNCN